MKNSFLLLVTFCFLYQPAAYTQKFTGEWYGVGNVSKSGSHNSYLSELIIKQKGNTITGEFNYYFRTVTTKTKITGTYNAQTKEILLNAHPLLNYKAQSQNGADCPMEGSLTLRISGADTTLQGQFNPVYAYRYTCPAINVKLAKQKANEDITLADLIPIEKEEEELSPPAEVKEKVAAPAPEKEIIEKLVTRSFETSNVIDVDADSLKVTLYDNGEVDNDTISLFYNRKLVTFKKLLSSKPLTFTLPLDTAVNEIAMYAENLGSIPPNTALCIVYAGGQRFEMSLSSTYIKNAAIRFRKKPKL
ncbi:MAG: hypothetical protein H0X70_02250 [Segetibacter sp.]|nr:hypothetical protein [Segetibacter sp.]